MAECLAEIMKKYFRPAKRGITFVELLIAALVFSILVAGLSLHLRGGIVAWRRSTLTLDKIQRIRVALDTVESDLSNAFIPDPGASWQPVNDFSSEAMRFYIVRQIKGAKPGAGEVLFIEYQLEKIGKKNVLSRTARSMSQAHLGIEAAPSYLLEDIDRIRLRYGYPPDNEDEIDWRDAWAEKNKLPLVLEFTIEGSWEASLPKIIKRIFLIPMGNHS
jgi:type II secretory pathway component PulJ